MRTNPEWRGRVFESAVGAQLARFGGELSYWRDGDSEVDFIYELNGNIFAIEVKSGRKKSSQGMIQCLRRFKNIIPITITTENGERFLKVEERLDEELLSFV